MSYILDALRRADAERTRGAVPGLHAQPTVAALADEAAPHRRWPLSALLAVAALLVVSAVLWLLWQRPPAAVPAASPPALPTAAPAAPAGALATAPAPAAAPPVVPPVVPLAALQATPPAVPPPRPAGRTVAPVGMPASPPTSLLPSPPSPSSASVAAAAVAADRPLALAELPEPARRELGALVLGGSVYAEQPAARLVIINGQVFHEGERPLPALLIEQIRLKSLLVNLRGQRVLLPL